MTAQLIDGLALAKSTRADVAARAAALTAQGRRPGRAGVLVGVNPASQVSVRNPVTACEEAGILGALPGILGSMQAMEVIKEILEIGDSLAGRILMYDALAARFFETKLTWNPDNPLNGRNPTIHRIRGENYRN